MNWEAIGAVGEILGGITVIATIVYLAVQVRQATSGQRHAISWAITQALTDINARLSGDGEFAELWIRGCDDLDKLDAVESERFGAFAMDLLNIAIYMHTHPTVEHSAYLDQLTELARNKPGFGLKVASVGSMLPADLYARIAGQ